MPFEINNDAIDEAMVNEIWDPKLFTDKENRRKARQKVSEAITMTFKTHPLYYSMLQGMARLEASDLGVDTLAVGFKPGSNVLTLFYNRNFVATLSRAQMKVFTVFHEMGHIGLNHLGRMRGKDQKISNLAADVIVNGETPEYAELPDAERIGITADKIDCLNKIDVRTSTMEALYYIMQANKDTDKSLQKLLAQMEGGKGSGFDQHDMWNGGQPMEGEGDGKGGVVPAEGELTAEQQAAVDSLMKGAISRLGGRDPGRVPGELRRIIEELRKVRNNWRSLLTIFVQSVARDDRQTSWKRYNRRLGNVSPGYKREYRPRLLVVIDNSGSINGPLYNLFINHCCAISEVCEEVKGIGVDTDVNCEFEVKHGKLPTDFDLKSGGGTAFQPAFDYAKVGKYDGIIYLTDGYGPAPHNTYGIPVIFALCPGGAEVPGFRNIHIED